MVTRDNMDRRQRKTRQAIFDAFIELLGKKDFSKITVEQIIDKADIGRATFYAHFETKDYLLKELSEELFCHIFDATGAEYNTHKHIFDCSAPSSPFLHLFMHIKNNDNHILDLLSSGNNQLFLQYFKKGIRDIAKSECHNLSSGKTEHVPTEFLVEHITSSFVTVIQVWVQKGMKETPEKLNSYFTSLLGLEN